MCSMLVEASKIIKDSSVLRRLVFASSVLPEDTPQLWEIATKFATYKNSSEFVILPEQARILTDNITFTDQDVLTHDDTLLKELVFMPLLQREHVGMILISRKNKCVLCGSKLLLRADQPSNIILYTDSHGTLPAIHYSKYCSKRGCNVVHHYGYYTNGDSSKLHFDKDWEEHQYFISSQETAFELELLRRFDVELLIGQMSYKQRAEIYNAIHNYDDVKKRCSTRDDHSEKCPVEDM